ncbi:glutaminase [Chelativorans sp. J32]|uniref:glutaminase n=1 Tax=Chelativorans sp. J32 TaxID=935840 RepID=UPI00048666A3|nr:glutaminase [Chelativorans sp. J32]
MPHLQEILPKLVSSLAARSDRGSVATYIPELAKVDPTKFGIAVATLAGSVVAAGNADELFSIQSISKVFTLALALGKCGDMLWTRVGREPSGNRFNSIVQLEYEKGVPRNPFVNAGALVVTDSLLAGHEPREVIGEILRFVRFLADDDTISVNRAVAASEQSTASRNMALAHYMHSFGNLQHAPQRVLGTYVHHCAIDMNCRQLAAAGLFLAAGGRNPLTGHSVISPLRARRINALMLTCGHYDASGDFAFRVGIPSKSGVGGGILGIVPGVASVAVWSPGLDSSGNSHLGTIALEELVQAMDWSVFAPRAHA